MPPRPAPADDATRGPRHFALLDRGDLGWIAELTDAVANLAGQPWRIALDAIEAGSWRRENANEAGSWRRDDAFEAGSWRRDNAFEAGAWRRDNAFDDRARDRDAASRASPRRLNAATTALRRLLTGRADDAALARKARALLLGPPALDDAARESRIATVATLLAITPATLERVLWADVPRERPIELTRGRPTASDVAALANVGLLQRALARAHSLELVIRGDASPLLRGCAARGLLVTASEREAAAPAGTSLDAATVQPALDTNGSRRDIALDTNDPRRETVLDITGPLALCHGTAVYGRALGSLVPLLATCETFALTIRAETRGTHYELRVDSPALLPAAVPRSWALVERLAADLERVGAPHGLRVRRAPPALVQPTARGGALACPDLGIELGDRIIWIEVVGFWTPEYLARKLARYRAVGASEVVLCVDATRACDDDDPPPGACVMRFERRVHAEPLLQLLGIGATG